MKILVDARHLGERQPSGVGEYTRQLLCRLPSIDSTNSYYWLTAGRRRPDLKKILSAGAGQVHCRIPNKIINAAAALLGQPNLEQIAGRPSDLIFLPNLNFVSIPANRPLVLTLHDLSFRLFPEFYSKKMRLWHQLIQPQKIIARASHVICPSQCTKRDLIRLYGKDEKQITVIPHGLRPEFYPDSNPADKALHAKYNLPARFALVLGTLEPRKNLEALLQGMREYRDQAHDDLPLIIAGRRGWRSRAIWRMMENPAYRSWVHYLDYVPAADRPGLMRRCAVFLWPSIYEGFGLPALEALACGAPAVVSHTSSLPEITGGAALQIDPYNSRDLARALTELFSCPDLKRKLKSAGPLQAQKFSWTSCAQQTLAVFEKTAKS